MDYHLSTRLLIEKIRPSILVEEKEVEIDLALFFPRSPLECISGESRQVSYEQMCLQIIERETVKKKFQLIEHLAYTLHTALKKELPMTIEIMVKVKKIGVVPAISFTYFREKEMEMKKGSRWDEE